MHSSVDIRKVSGRRCDLTRGLYFVNGCSKLQEITLCRRSGQNF